MHSSFIVIVVDFSCYEDFLSLDMGFNKFDFQT